MKIAVFGATGRTGQHLVGFALEKGYEVTALARTPEKLGLRHANLQVLQGDVKDAQRVEQTLLGAQAVISVLGPAGNQPVFEVSQGIENILAGMQRQGLRRLVMSAGAGVGDPQDAPKFINHVISFLLKITAPNVLADMTRAVNLVRNSDLDWTVVRLPMLTDGPKTGAVKAAYVGKGMGARISRADAAGFILEQVTSHAYVRQSPAVSA